MAIRLRNIAWLLSLAGVLFLLSGCIGFYGNTKRFLQPPTEGMEEIEMLKQFGEPSFCAVVEDQKVYSYKVRDVKYIVLVGTYNGYDLIVVCRDGRVIEVKKMPRNRGFTLFTPPAWTVAD